MYAAIAALLVLCLSSYLHIQQINHNSLRVMNQYGESIAQLTAEQSVTSALQNDAISLQAIGQGITDKAKISSVIIYNINNSILAQANNDQSTDSELNYYTSPIVSSNNIIGSVTVGISASQFISPYPYNLVTAIAFILICIILLAYAKDRIQKSARYLTQPKTDEHTRQHEISEQKSNTANESNTNTAQKTETRYIHLVFDIQNIDMLYQQLNGELRTLQIEQLEKNITNATHLYGGIKSTVTNRHITLRFEHTTEGLLNAVYTSELVRQLNQENTQSIIILNSLILEDHTASIGSAIDHSRKSIGTNNQHMIFIQDKLITDYELHSRLSIEKMPIEDLCILKALKGTHKTLLDNQLKQLQE